MAAQVAISAPIVVHHGFAAPAAQQAGSGSPLGSSSSGSGSSSPSAQQAMKRATSLLSLMLSTPRDEACYSPGQLAAMESDCSEDYSDDEDDVAEGQGLSPAIEICIRDERHYRAMLQARAVVNSRLCAAAYPQQQHYHQQAAPQAARH